MFRVRLLAGYLVGPVLVVALSGCGGRSDLPPMARVQGTVLLDGQPLPRGTVQFMPEPTGGGPQPTGTGEIDQHGRYEIVTAGVQGAVIGTHHVGVVATEQVDLNVTSFAPSLIPLRYNNPLSSGLTVEVKQGQRNTLDLELRSSP